MIKKILLVGEDVYGSLENSYLAAFRDKGVETELFDFPKAVKAEVRLGWFGEKINLFLPVEAWISRANRKLIMKIKESGPDLIIVGGATQVRVGALAQIRSMFPDIKILLLWPDPLLRFWSHVAPCLAMYDMVATFNNSTVNVFKKLGVSSVSWIPFAADQGLHSSSYPLAAQEAARYGADVSFIGNWQPEREDAVLFLLSKGYKVKVWGSNSWPRHAQHPRRVKEYWQGCSVHGAEFVKVVKASKFNLNIIDATTFPAANMRFFEILCAGGVEICSSCPEMEKDFIHGKDLFYFNSCEELANIIEGSKDKPEVLFKINRSGQKLVAERHTYLHRAEQILSMIEKVNS